MSLEEGKPNAEVAEPTPTEGAKPTQEEKPTISFTQKELDTAVGKGVSSLQSQLSLSKAEIASTKANEDAAKADAKVLEDELHRTRREYDDFASKQLADDPDARKAFIDRRTIADGEMSLTKREKDAERKLYEANKMTEAVRMARKADALIKETGISLAELEDCRSEEEMEVRALRFQMTKGAEKPEDKAPPKVESGVTSTGTSKLTTKQIANMSPEERFARSEEIASVPMGYTSLKTE